MKHSYQHQISIRWDDIDQLKHVNNVVYYRYISEARIATYHQWGVMDPDATTAPVVVKSGATFFSPLTYPDTAIINSSVTKVGVKSLTMIYDIYSMNTNTLAASGFATLVWTNKSSGASCRIPEGIISLLPAPTTPADQ